MVDVAMSGDAIIGDLVRQGKIAGGSLPLLWRVQHLKSNLFHERY
jgi:hypothetical protein